MAQWRSEQKKQSFIAMREKHPELPLSIIAKQHGIAITTAYKWWGQYQKEQAAKN